MILAQLDCLRVQYDESLRLLRYQWCGGHQLHSFTQAMDYLADLVQAHRIRRVLVDLNGLPDLSTQEQMWVSANWLPRVSVRSVRQVAVVLPPAGTYNQMVVENLLGLGHHLTRLNVQFFAEPTTGLEWLTASALHMLALSAEWQAAG